ncbi:hypothetical protein ACSMXN_07630 [Jatrophihabitans sp. DSM 45814]
MSRWHNWLGEDGQRLTILSVLPRVALDRSGLDSDTELSLREAIDELFRIAGEDGNAQVVLNVTGGADDDPEFTTEENVSLHDLAERLYGSFGPDGETASFLRILNPDDDPLGLPPTGPASPEDTDRSPLATLRRLREAVHRLFGGSVDEGVPPTVLSLLIAPSPAPKPDPPSEAAR